MFQLLQGVAVQIYGEFGSKQNQFFAACGGLLGSEAGFIFF